MSNDIIAAIAEAFAEMVPIALFFALCVRLTNALFGIVAGKERLL